MPLPAAPGAAERNAFSGSKSRSASRWLAVSCAAFAAWVPSAASAQLAVEDVVRGTFAALAAGDSAAVQGEYMPDAHIELAYGGGRELTVAEWLGLAQGTDWTVASIESRVFGATAVTLAEVQGELRFLGGVTLEGSFRYSESRVRDGSTWKIIQQEIEPL